MDIAAGVLIEVPQPGECLCLWDSGLSNCRVNFRDPSKNI